MSTRNLSNVSDDAKALAEFMEGVLERVVNVFESYSLPVPDRKYWTLGDPAVDCEQLVVNFLQMYLGPPGGEVTDPSRCNDPRTAVLNIQVSRKVPTVGPSQKAPSAEDIQYHSNLIAYDAWVLMASINDLDMWAESGLGLGVIATVNVAEPQGGYHTTVMTLTMAIP